VLQLSNNGVVPTLDFEQARSCVLNHVRPLAKVEEISLEQAAGRVLAEDVLYDRDYPTTDRSVRDGFALRSADLPGTLAIIGEVRAGEAFDGEIGPGQTVEIMTGAPVPRGADQIVMVEHASVEAARMTTTRPPSPQEFINPRGGEAKAHAVAAKGGVRLDYAGIAQLAMVGTARVKVFAKPRVAVLATGDEIIPVDGTPRDFQIRNSNSYSVAAQVVRAGGEPVVLPVAKDTLESTRQLIETGLQSDLLLLTGGVSAGKYDLVETVLAEFGAEFYFDRVRIQPGQPLVFGRARGTFFFGLPGNPGSSMVTFELFARAALEMLGGQSESKLLLAEAKLSNDFRHRTGLTRFLPAQLSEDGRTVTHIPWQGSSDIPAIARANAFLIALQDKEQYRAGDPIQVLIK
jgi:molybdopterin molybdotransferase